MSAESFRIGQGFDAHRFGDGDHLMLGGVRIAYVHGLVAHSDGDVLLHALGDALLGAAALGDIGGLFPDTDARWAGADSGELLAEVMRRVRGGGWRVINADCTVIAERPQLAPHVPAMRTRIAELLGVKGTDVNVKATTAEKMGFIGRGEGIAALAVVLLAGSEEREMNVERREHDGGVIELALNRPPVNALSPDFVGEFAQALDAAGNEARAIVVSGRPGMFSAGLDVPLLLTLDRAAMQAFWQSFFGVLETLARSPVPVGMAITGHCPAGGMVLSLFGDYRIAAEGDFKLGLNEVQVGLPMPLLIFGAFRRLIGARAAEQLAVSGRLIPPEEALAVGMVDALAPVEQVVGRAVAQAQALAALPPGAVVATRELARADLTALFDDLGAAHEEINEVWFSTETQAAMRALVARLAAKRSG